MRAARRARNRIAQTTAFWLFRFATYCILAAATYIFLDIGVKGGRTVFTTHPAFRQRRVPDRAAADALRLRLSKEKK